MTNTPAALANIAAPADATHVGDWVDEGDLGLPCRWFCGTERTVAGGLRELAADLLAAANELDQLA